MEQTMDSLLAELAGMGFELERCQAAVSAGKLTVQEAVDWLLQGGDREVIASRSTPALSLIRPQSTPQNMDSSSESGYLPFSLPPIPPEQSSPSPSPSSPPQQNPSATSPSKLKEDEDPKVASRYHLTDQKKTEKERWEREEREKAQTEARAKKRSEKEARDQILREIKADKEARLIKTGKGAHQDAKSPSKTDSTTDADTSEASTVATASPSSSSSTQAGQKATPAAEESQKAQPVAAAAQSCTLQIRLPSGKSVREKFDASTTLRTVQEEVSRKQPHIPGIGFMQPFPHRLFTEADLSSTLAQLKLTPSGCLVVRTDTQGPPNKMQRSEVDQSPSESPSASPEPEERQSYVSGLRSGGPPRHLTPQNLPGMMPGQAPGQPPIVPGFNPLGRSNPAIAPMGFMRPPGAISPSVGRPIAGHVWGKGQSVGGEGGQSVEGEGEQAAREDEGGDEDRQGEADVEEDDNVMMEQAQGMLEHEGEMEAGDEEGDEMEDEEEDEAGAYPNVPWGIPGRRGGDWPRGGQFDMEGGANQDWGSGNRLGGNQHNFEYGFGGGVGAQQQPQPQAGEADDVPNPRRAAEAALQRLAARSQPSTSSTRQQSDKPVTSLLDSCLKCVSKRFEGHTKHPVTAVEALPPQLAIRLINELKKAGVLRHKTLRLFLPCHLQQLSLDSYKYTTNELVQALRYHTSLSRLSLSACPLITDQAVAVISHLKRLQHVNLSNNKKLTDNVCRSLAELPNLVTVVLEGTAVTDRGVEAMAVTAPQQLCNLNLSRTTVTDAIFSLLAEFPSLKNLGLESTNVITLENLEHLTGLKVLNIARNSISLEGLQRVKRLAALIALNISHLVNIPGDEALQCIQGMQLQQLQLPDRHTTTDVGLRCIAGMPLTGLDMTDYIHITNDGVHHIADMTSLRKLSLSNTKVTDTAMTYIQGLTSLEELLLDRTAITDEGAKVLGAFLRLQFLSMAGSQISNQFLCSGVLNSCVRLTRLNLSRVTVSNEGVLALNLPYLAQLNLDYTCVKEDVARQLKQTCPSVKVVRTSNLRPTREAEGD